MELVKVQVTKRRKVRIKILEDGDHGLEPPLGQRMHSSFRGQALCLLCSLMNPEHL